MYSHGYVSLATDPRTPKLPYYHPPKPWIQVTWMESTVIQKTVHFSDTGTTNVTPLQCSLLFNKLRDNTRETVPISLMNSHTSSSSLSFPTSATNTNTNKINENNGLGFFYLYSSPPNSVNLTPIALTSLWGQL